MFTPDLPSIIINNMDKLKMLATLDEDGIQSDGYLYSLLRTHNLHLIFAPLFHEHKDNKGIAVVKSAFLIMAYTNKSTWIDLDKDWYMNKKEILSTIIHDSEIPIDNDLYDSIVGNNDKVLCNVMNWYIHNQKDNLFNAIIAYSENISLGQKLATDNSDTKNSADVTRITENLNKLKINQDNLDELKQKVKKKYSPLDEIMAREGKQVLSEDLDLSITENRLRYIANNNLFGKKVTSEE